MTAAGDNSGHRPVPTISPNNPSVSRSSTMMSALISEPREVRRIIVGDYELRYEIDSTTIIILRLSHHRENRSFDSQD